MLILSEATSKAGMSTAIHSCSIDIQEKTLKIKAQFLMCSETTCNTHRVEVTAIFETISALNFNTFQQSAL